MNNKHTGFKKHSGHRPRRRPPFHRRNGGRGRKVYGALDLGTHNCRLLIAKLRRGTMSVVTSYSRIVRLGEGVAGSGRLSEAAMDRTLKALKTSAAKFDEHGVTRLRVIATEACRRAENCEEFLWRVKDETGLELEAISSEEEARLALAGCQGLMEDGARRALVFDIGGGSTELVWAGQGEPGGGENGGSGKANGRFSVIDMLSLPMGVVTLSESNGGGVLDEDHYGKMVAQIAGRLPEFCERNQILQEIAQGRVQMLGTSGTVTTLGAIHLELPSYSRARIDGFTISFDGLEQTIRRVVGADHAARIAMPCIGAERADLMIPGCAIVQAIRERWPVGRLRIADRGLREGILLDLMMEDGLQVASRPAANAAGRS